MRNKSLILTFAGALLGLITDFVTSKQTEIAVEKQVNDILRAKGLVEDDDE